MLKNLSVYVMFRANGEEEEYKARRNVRFFVVFYIVVILIFEVINMYYNYKVWCLDCDKYPKKNSLLVYFTLNLIRFFFNLTLVIISFKHANQLKNVLKETKQKILSNNATLKNATFTVDQNPSPIGSGQKYIPLDSDFKEERPSLIPYKRRMTTMMWLYYTTGFTFLLINLIDTIFLPTTGLFF